MIRLLGLNLNNNKKIYIALTSIYGIGISTSKKILNELNINIHLKVTDLSQSHILVLRNYLEKSNLKLEGELKRFIQLNIKHLININSRKGIRHLKGLPIHGQRTRTNSRTTRKKILFLTKK